MKLPSVSVGLVALLATNVSAAIWTSYISIEVPASTGGPAQALYEVVYDTSLFPDENNITGADLVECIFGVATPAGLYMDAFGGSNPYSIAGTASDNVGYIDFSFGRFVESFTIAGTTYAQGTNYDPSWSYYVAGGSGDNAGGFGVPGNYSPSSFVLSNDGFGSRQITNGSFDAFVLGATTVPSLNPTAADFAGATRILHIPEPGRASLLALGLLLASCRRKR